MSKHHRLKSIIFLVFIYLVLFSFPSLAAIPGDFNADGKVDFEDLMIFALAYGSTTGSSNWNAACDLDPNGKIDFEDLMIFAMNYGKEGNTITIQPGPAKGKDVYLYSLFPDNNDSDSNWLIVGLYQVGYVYRSLLQFDLSGLPANAVIASAHLQLYQYDHISYSSTPQDFTIDVYKINDPWQEEIVTWNTIPGNQNIPESTCPVTLDAVTWLSWNITDLVQEWLDEPSSNYGVLLRDRDETSGNAVIYCRSSDYLTDPSLRPKLEITYYVP